MQNDKHIHTFILTLLELPGIGPRTISKFLFTIGSDLASQRVLDEDFARYFLGEKVPSGLRKRGCSWSELEARSAEALKQAESEDIAVLCPFDEHYPQRMLNNQNFPPILFVKGDLAALNPERSVAIIGSREPTALGRQWGREATKCLVDEGYAIVSGLALGSDTVAHTTALEAGGVTVATLPTPIDGPVYPKENHALAERIVGEGGALVSEYRPGTVLRGRQLASNLVARDEWQPALSDGVLALETSTTGGTRHAMNHALATNTPLAAFDYSAVAGVDFYGDRRFSGNVDFIQRGALAITAADDLDAFMRQMDSYRAAEHIVADQFETSGSVSYGQMRLFE